MTNSKDTFTFNGFEPANTTPVPDILFDKLLSELSGSELKVLLYIIRRTWGFKKDTDAISLSQFTDGIITREGKVLDKGCGIKNRTTVSAALAELEKIGCIKSDKGDDPLGDKATNLYTIRFKGSTKSVLPAQQGSIENVPPSAESVPPVVSKSHHRSNQNAPRVVSKTYPQETVLQQTDKQDTELQERESSPNTLDTHTIVSSDTAHADEYPLITFADCLSYLQEQGVAPRGEDAVQVMIQARTLYARKHPRYEYRARPGLSEHPDDQLPSKQNEQVFTNDEPQGDTHATASGYPHRVGEPAARGGDSGHAPVDNGQVATPETRPVLEAGQEITEGDTHATRVPTLPRADHPASLERDASGHPQSDNHRAVGATDDLPVVRAVGRGTPGPQGSRDGKDTSPLTPAQSLPLPQDAQAASGSELVTHCYLCGELVSREPVPGPLVCESCKRKAKQEPKWNAQAMVAKACELRGKPFSDTARPKETKAAQKLFDRKSDLTEEEFERAFQQWNTQWWRETNGLFNLTDLAAVPKNKSEMRLIIALEKLALSKAITRQSGQIIPISGTKRYSSYDDPNFSSENDFYPVEGGSYAAASI